MMILIITTITIMISMICISNRQLINDDDDEWNRHLVNGNQS